MRKEPSIKRRSNRHGGRPLEDNTSAHRVGSMSSHVPVWLGSRMRRLTFVQVKRGDVWEADASMNGP
jgi:hypothetical protein